MTLRMARFGQAVDRAAKSLDDDPKPLWSAPA
jgi:hypothetical protein